MLTFRTISISDREWIQKALQQSQYQGCEYSFANNLAWYRGSDSRIASFQGFYIIAAFDTPDGIPDVTVPSGSGDWDALLRELVETLCPNGEPLRFTGVTREMAAFLQQRFPDAENGVSAAGLHRICRSFRKRAFRRTGQVPGNGCICLNYNYIKIIDLIYIYTCRIFVSTKRKSH